MIAKGVAAGMDSCSRPDWLQPGATALLLVDLQQGTCGDAQPQQRPAFDQQFRIHTLPATQRALAAARRSTSFLIAAVAAPWPSGNGRTCPECPVISTAASRTDRQ